MNQDWKIRVQAADHPPYAFKATFVERGSGRDESVLNARYLYGDGDLAVLLEDLGALPPEILGLIQALQGQPRAEILIDISEEAMEVLAEHATRGRIGRA